MENKKTAYRKFESDRTESNKAAYKKGAKAAKKNMKRFKKN